MPLLSILCSEAVSLHWLLRCPLWLTAVSSSVCHFVVLFLFLLFFPFRLLFLLNWWRVGPSLSAPLVTPCPRRLNLLEARCAFPMQQRQKIKTLMLYRPSLWCFSVVFMCVFMCVLYIYNNISLLFCPEFHISRTKRKSFLQQDIWGFFWRSLEKVFMPEEGFNRWPCDTFRSYVVALFRLYFSYL